MSRATKALAALAALAASSAAHPPAAANCSQDLRGKRIWVPITSTAHYIVLVALAEFEIDISSDITVEFKSPQEIREAWDAGTIDGAGCWGNTLTHLTSRPHGGTNETGPGHIIVDATTVARWGYITRNNLVTTREKLYELETDRIESGGANLVLNTLQYFARANYDYRYRPRPRPGEPEGVWGANGTYNTSCGSLADRRRRTPRRVREFAPRFPGGRHAVVRTGCTARASSDSLRRVPMLCPLAPLPRQQGLTWI